MSIMLHAMQTSQLTKGQDKTSSVTRMANELFTAMYTPDIGVLIIPLLE